MYDDEGSYLRARVFGRTCSSTRSQYELRGGAAHERLTRALISVRRVIEGAHRPDLQLNVTEVLWGRGQQRRGLLFDHSAQPQARYLGRSLDIDAVEHDSAKGV